MPDYIFNTTALSNFAAANSIHLLATRYDGVGFTTVEVGQELKQGVESGYTYLDIVYQELNTNWLRILGPTSTIEHRLRTELDKTIDSGEASCLVLAISRQLTFVTDDKVARQVAQARNVPLTGTLGILAKSVRESYLSLPEANTILTTMIQHDYRSLVDSLDELV